MHKIKAKKQAYAMIFLRVRKYFSNVGFNLNKCYYHGLLTFEDSKC